MQFHIPIENPVIVLALCLSIILVVPPVCRRIGMPSIFGLILAGIAIGPKGFHLIGEKSGLELLSTAGLLYLMFLMTLEIDMYSFRKNKFKSVWFGIFTFLIPFVLGYLVTRYAFGYSNTASLLLACMFSTHTLVSYPIAGRLNITKTEPVVISIGGTIITDMAVLLFLTIITTAYSGSLDLFFWIKTIVSLGGFMFLMLWVFPKVSRWYFSHFQSDDSAQYIFILCSLFIAAFLAELAGIEPIVGAFLCGLALNRVIPHQSSLMSRTIFIGNSIFIPFFLIHIGMLVDITVFFKGSETLILAAALIVVALFSKYIAAYATRLIYKYTKAEQLLLFGLSSSHAAATIAVVLVGYNMGIFDEYILNAVVLIILFTCLVSTYYTDYAGRKVAVQQKEQEVQENKSDRILLPLSNPESAFPLFDFAVLIHQPHEESIIYPLTVATKPVQLEQSMLKDKVTIEFFAKQSDAAKVRFYPEVRIDVNISEGIIRAAMELQTSHIILGWSGQSGTARYFFGTILDNLLDYCKQTVLVTKLITKILKFQRIYVMVPRNAEHEIGFHAWLVILQKIQRNTSGELLFIGDRQTLSHVSQMNEVSSLTGKNYRILDDFPDMPTLSGELTGEDVFIVISARQNTVSFSRKLILMPRVITRYFGHTNCVILYPEQPDVSPDNLGTTFGGF
ncbi:MAG: cation:proton antiporter [Bacteroidales bacterium]|jgi:Kef-type K+ transport system membrane component KefB/nucleotide-binding universal stress UspA family protein|nr:cation:proton antiporter [Bacteroidales bacterium]